MSFQIPDADTLVSYLLDWTGSTNTSEIQQCIFQAELAMRNIELPANRTDPYNTFGVVGANQLMPIPADMNKPILFFQQGSSGNSGQESTYGPWIVFDRVGDRDIIADGLVAQLYLSPVIRGKFSEVGSNYQFLPYVAEGTVINLYYYRAWNLLFTPIYDDTNTQVGIVETNPVLQTWPEGYVYGTLHEYYLKRHSSDDAAIYKAKFDEAWRTVNNQNNLGKWSGGSTRLTSIFQPRRDRTYAVK